MWYLPLALALLAGLVYLFTAPPSMLWLDAAGFVAAMVTLGVPNPPEPLYVLTGHFATLLPFGSIIFRLQIFSALLAAGTLIILYKLTLVSVEKLKSPKSLKQPKVLNLAALFGTASLAFSYQFWSQAQNIETFILVSAIVAAVLALLVTIRDQKTFLRNMLIIALLLGLGSGTNPVVMSVAPSVLYGLWIHRRYLTFKHFVLLSLVGPLCVVAIYSYIPIRANANPFWNWGRAQTFQDAFGVATGRGLNVYAPELGVINGFTGSPEVFIDSSLYYLEMMRANFTLVILPFILVGAIYLWTANEAPPTSRSGYLLPTLRRERNPSEAENTSRSSASLRSRFSAKGDKNMFFLFGLTAFTNLTLAGLYFSGNKESWFLVSWVVFAVLAGLGFSALAQKLYKLKLSFLVWLLFIVSIVPFIVWWPVLDRREWHLLDDYIENLYRPIKEPAILVGSADLFGSTSYYVHDARNPDRKIIPVIDNILYVAPWYGENLGRVTDIKIPDTSNLLRNSQKEYSNFMNEFFAANTDRYRIYITHPAIVNRFMSPGPEPSLAVDQTRFKLVPQGMVYELVAKGSQPAINLEYFDFKFETKGFPQKKPVMLERAYQAELRDMLTEYAFSLIAGGDALLSGGRREDALKFYERAYEFTPENPEIVRRIEILRGAGSPGTLQEQLLRGI